MFEAGTHPLEEEWVALDVETTGLSPEDDEIIEVGAVRFRGAETLDTFHSLVNPNRKIGAFIRRYTGITQQEVDAAAPFSKVAGRLESFVGGLPIVGHNVDFDLGFLAAKGVRFTGPKADTLELAYVLKPSWEYSLEKVAAALGISHDNPHRALGDAEVTSRVFALLVEEAGRLDEYSLAEMQRLAAHGRPGCSLTCCGGSRPTGCSKEGRRPRREPTRSAAPRRASRASTCRPSGSG